MRTLFVLGLSLFMVLASMLVTPGASYAEENVAVATVKENPISVIKRIFTIL